MTKKALVQSLLENDLACSLERPFPIHFLPPYCPLPANATLHVSQIIQRETSKRNDIRFTTWHSSTRNRFRLNVGTRLAGSTGETSRCDCARFKMWQSVDGFSTDQAQTCPGWSSQWYASWTWKSLSRMSLIVCVERYVVSTFRFHKLRWCR